MSEFEKQKISIAMQIKNLCAHCANDLPHHCRLQNLADQIRELNGVPLIVNDRFNGLLFTN
ncbi:MAG: hypothetical protein ACM3NH_03420 [Candidatus Saccharibacteria bacterium]